MFSHTPRGPSVRVPRYGRSVHNGRSLKMAGAFCAGVLSTLAVGALAMVGTSTVTSLGVVDRAAVVPAHPPEAQPVTNGKGQSATSVPAAANAAADGGSKSAQPDKTASTGTADASQTTETTRKAATAAPRATDTGENTKREDAKRTSKIDRHATAKAADDATRPKRAQSRTHARAASAEASEAKSQESDAKGQESEAKSQETVGNSDQSEAKPEAERTTKKHHRSKRSARSRAREDQSVQVYELPDGRRIIVRRPGTGADRDARLSERDRDAFGAFDAQPRPERRLQRRAAPFDYFFGPPDQF